MRRSTASCVVSAQGLPTAGNLISCGTRHAHDRKPRYCLRILHILLTLTMVGARDLPAQARNLPEISFNRVTAAEGELPTPSALCFVSDRQGYLWFGTLDGLVRYDGYSFTIFRSDGDDSLSIGGNLVYDLCEDRQGSIWVATVGGGLSRFNPKTETFVTYRATWGDPRSLSHNNVYTLLEDRRGRLWIGTLRGLDLFIPSDNCFKRVFPSAGDIPHDQYIQVTSLAEDVSDAGGIWIGTFGHGVLRLDSTGTNLRPLRAKGQDSTSVVRDNIPFLCQYLTDPNVLWIGTGGSGLLRYDITDRTLTSYLHDPRDDRTISSNYARSMMKDRSGMHWVGTSGGGLNYFDQLTGSFVRFQHDPSDSRSLPNNYILSLHQDASGVYWVGTRIGICRFIDPWQQFVVHRNDPRDQNTLSDNFLYGIYQDGENMIWIASHGGLNRLDPSTGNFQHYRHRPGDPTSLRNDLVRTIYEDGKGRLWVGNEEGTLHLFDRATGRSRAAMQLDTAQANRFDVRAILEAKDGVLWVGTGRGLFAVDPEKWTSHRVSVGALESDLSIANQINALFEDSSNAIWIGTGSKGLIVYNPRSGVASTYTHGVAENQRVRLGSVTSIRRSRNGEIWITGLHLSRYRGEVEGFQTIPLDTDGYGDGTYGFLEDNSGNFWISTNYGLLRFNLATGRLKRFTVQHGLPANEFNSRSFCMSHSGLMYFGTVNGMVSFYPDSIQLDDHIPPVVITKFRVFDRELKLDTSLANISQVVLPYDRNFLSFEYAALDFRDSPENTYMYKLEGLDPEWVQAGTRRYAAYASLEPGLYTFRVKGSNGDGFWNEQGACLRVLIRPPWWGTRWFQGSALVMVAVAAYGLYRYQVSRILAMGRMRIRIADDLHDDIGSELSAIALESDLIARHLNHGETERQRIAEVARSIRTAADKLRDVVWIVNPEQDKLEDLVERMRDVARCMLNGIEVQFTSTNDGRARTLDMEFKRNVLLMFKEILNNVLRHADATRVTIFLEETDDNMYVCVVDNGKGFDRTAVTHGRGLKSLAARAEAIGGSITVESAPGGGTKACINARIARSGD